MENIRQVSSFIKKIESRNIVVRRSFDPKSKNGMIYVVIGLDVDDSSFKKEFRKEFHAVEWQVFFDMSGRLTHDTLRLVVHTTVSSVINYPEPRGARGSD
jgi:uncharacterized protein with HEPN domain